jgi:hypothetical protein
MKDSTEAGAFKRKPIPKPSEGQKPSELSEKSLDTIAAGKKMMGSPKIGE